MLPVQSQTLNSVAIKKLVKIVKYLECLANIYSTIVCHVDSVCSGPLDNAVIQILHYLQNLFHAVL